MNTLISTLEEFRAGVPVNVTSSIDLLRPPVAAAERKHLVPMLGRAQYRELLDAYQASSLSTEQAELLKLVQVGVANLSYAGYVTVAQLQMEDTGIRVVLDGQSRTASQWQIDDLREYLAETGYSALEEALDYLEEHKSDFPAWATSAAYTANKEQLLNSTAEFQRWYNINSSHLTFLALLPILRRQEALSLEPVLSYAFCEALRTEIQTGTVSADTQAVLKLLHPALANFTVAEALDELSVDVAKGGLVVREQAVGGDNNRTKRQAPADVLATKRSKALENGRTYLGSLVSLLNSQASATKYPDYFTSDRYVAPTSGPGPYGPPSPRRRVYGAC
jgi:hypothetical protein